MRTKKMCSWVLVFAMMLTVFPSYSGAKSKVVFKNVTGTKKTMYVGSSFALKANAAAGKLTFTSSRKNIAAVTGNGVITAKKTGVAVITVKNKSAKVSKKLKVTVKKAIAYQINKTSGTYSGTQNIKVTAKKGYMVYYSTNGKFNAGKVIKAKKSKTFKISKTTTLNLYPVKRKKKLSTSKLNKTKNSNKLCADYYYIIKPVQNPIPSQVPVPTSPSAPVSTSPSTQTPTTSTEPPPTATADSTPGIKSSPIVPVDVTQNDYTAPTRVTYTEFDTDDSEEAIHVITPLPPEVNDKNDYYEISKKGKVTIKQAGTYKISGEFASNINVEAPESEVHVILDGVTAVNNAEDSAFKIKKELNSNVVVTLAAGSVNVFTDNHAEMVDSGDKDKDGNIIWEEPDGAFTCKKGNVMTINGSGTLIANSILGTGIKSSGALKIMSGNFQINAGKNGISGKRYLGIKGGEFDITAGSVGIKTTEPEDSAEGYLDIADAAISIKSKENGIDGYSTVYLAPEELNIDEDASKESASSYRGIKAEKTIEICSGIIDINTIGDSLYSKGSTAIRGGIVNIQSAGKAVYAKYGLYIDGDDTRALFIGTEGIKSTNTTIAGGGIYIITSEKGIVCAEGQEGNKQSSGQLLITDGFLSVSSDGDGIDVNGSFFMENGILAVESPAKAIYSNDIFQIAGGALLATGDTLTTPTETTVKQILQINLPVKQTVGTPIDVKMGDLSIFDANFGRDIVLEKQFQTVLFSTPEMEIGNTVTCEIGSEKYNITLNDISNLN